MRKIKILDCTLRDGGYINNWSFGFDNILEIINGLLEANIDIIELGFFRPNDEKDCNRSVFTDFLDVTKLITHKKGVVYALMVEEHNLAMDKIPPYEVGFPQIIRITFRKGEWTQAKTHIIDLMNLGYQVCVQPVGLSLYSENEIINIVEEVNAICPHAFYIVDTLGTMYPNDTEKIFNLINNILRNDIVIGLHSHNNIQLSFANAQKFIEISRDRDIYIDSSCYGMGRGAGNLATELLVDFLNKNLGKNYVVSPILSIVDKNLSPIFFKKRWGYDIPYFLSGSNKCHPNYASFLMMSDTLTSKNIQTILSMIPKEKRYEFDKDFILQLYNEFQSNEIDDSESCAFLKSKICDKKVLILGSGSSIFSQHEKIEKYIIENNCLVISINFIDKLSDFAFFSNNKRADLFLNKKCKVDLLLTSNLLKYEERNVSFFNYSSLLGEGEACDNAGAMFIRLLKKIGIKSVVLAGFDGFDINADKNYLDAKLKKPMNFETAIYKNKVISKQLVNALNGLEYLLLTESKYEI